MSWPIAVEIIRVFEAGRLFMWKEARKKIAVWYIVRSHFGEDYTDFQPHACVLCMLAID